MTGHDSPHNTPPSSRRRFLGQAGALAGGLWLGRRATAEPHDPQDPQAATPLPTRVLGRTGRSIPVLGIGCACAGQSSDITLQQAMRLYETAIDEGVTFLDCARVYGKAEEALGQVLKRRRDEVFVTTKAAADDVPGAQRSFEESLRRLQTDHVDLLYWHGVGGRDIDAALRGEGPMAYVLEQKAAGRTAFAGATTHSHPTNMARLVASGLLDVTMVVLNFVDRHLYNFEEKLLPAAREQNVGVLAMKVFGGVRGNDWQRYDGPNRGPHMDPEHVRLALRYALDLPGVHGAVIGMHTEAQLRENIALAQQATPLTEAERLALHELGQQLAADWQPRFGPTA